MTEPKRWSDAQSEVDPVLRSVTRYAQRLQPDAGALQRLLLATAEARPAKPPVRPLHRFAVGVGVGLAAAFGGVAWASYGGWGGPPAAPAREPSAERAPARARPQAPAEPVSNPQLKAPLGRQEPRPGALGSVTPRPAPAEPPSAASEVASAAPAPALDEDAALLSRARGAVMANPSRALTLTRDHAVQFPESPLVEERLALRIESLSRLGRASEAKRELEAFEQRYPRSPYRRRLASLLGRDR
jgi:hypothetical protein